MSRVVLACIAACIGTLAAQQQPPTTPYVPKQSDRPEPLASGDEPGFQPIFDGKTLAGLGGRSSLLAR